MMTAGAYATSVPSSAVCSDFGERAAVVGAQAGEHGAVVVGVEDALDHHVVAGDHVDQADVRRAGLSRSRGTTRRRLS